MHDHLICQAMVCNADHRPAVLGVDAAEPLSHVVSVSGDSREVAARADPIAFQISLAALFRGLPAARAVDWHQRS